MLHVTLFLNSHGLDFASVVLVFFSLYQRSLPIPLILPLRQPSPDVGVPAH